MTQKDENSYKIKQIPQDFIVEEISNLKLDENGNQIRDTEGKPVMEANTARDIWITATTLTTALNMGILAYAVSGFVLLTGIMVIGFGLFAKKLTKVS